MKQSVCIYCTFILNFVVYVRAFRFTKNVSCFKHADKWFCWHWDGLQFSAQVLKHHTKPFWNIHLTLDLTWHILDGVVMEAIHEQIPNVRSVAPTAVLLGWSCHFWFYARRLHGWMLMHCGTKLSASQANFQIQTNFEKNIAKFWTVQWWRPLSGACALCRLSSWIARRQDCRTSENCCSRERFPQLERGWTNQNENRQGFETWAQWNKVLV